MTIGIVGLGLIGGSFAKAYSDNDEHKVLAYNRSKEVIQAAYNDKAIDGELNEGNIKDCDLILLCLYPQLCIDYLTKMAPYIRKDAMVIDCCGTKELICQSCYPIAKQYGFTFIGGHPMAGSEKTGYENSTDILLENAYYLLTPFEETPLENLSLLKELVAKTGANCVVLSPSEHDKITAAISHVPHIIAVSLVNMVRTSDNEEQNMKAFAAGGFKDITRIASSSPQMWQDICLANSESIDYFLSHFEKQIEDFRHMIAEKDGASIQDEFHTAGDYRDSIPAKKSSVIARSYDLFINIDDRAGAIATIATILSVNGISIKNIGIIHNREYVDGVMKLELYKEDDEKKARELLIQNRYDIVDRD